MLLSEKRAIGAHTYEVFQLGSLQARKTLIRVNRVLGPVIKAGLADIGLTEKSTPKQISERVTLGAIGNVLESIARNVAEEDLEYFCEVFGKASFVHIEGKRLPLTLEVQEWHFAGGNLLELFKWLAFALEWNYADFLDALPKKKKPDPQVKEQSK